MKKITILLIHVFVLNIVNAQLININNAPKGFSDSLNKIILDYKTNFKQVQGDLLSTEPEASIYLSKNCLQGSKKCIIKRFKSTEDLSASWQALMYNCEDEQEAKKMYKKIYNQVKGVKVNGIDKMTTTFIGKMDDMDDNMRFFSSSLRLKTDNVYYKDMIVDIELTNSYVGWEVSINVYRKKLLEVEEGN